MVENSDYDRAPLKHRLIKLKIIPCDNCAICGLKREWMGRPLVLVLDHINGVNNDHRKDNLRFICPNCNSQTDTFSGRNTRAIRARVCIQCGARHKRYSKTQTCKKCSDNNPNLKLRKVERPSKEDLERMIWEQPTTAIAKHLGVSDKAIEKWTKSYNIAKPPRGYWSKKACGEA